MIYILWFLGHLALIKIDTTEKAGGRTHTDMLVESVLNLIFHLHAGVSDHFGRHLKIFESQYGGGPDGIFSSG